MIIKLDRLGIVTVNYKSLKYTVDFVEKIKANIENFVLVVVNNSLEDFNDLDKLSSKNIKIINSKINLGYSGGLNLGLKYLYEQKGIEWFLIGNNDVLVDNPFVAKLKDLSDKTKIYSPVIMDVKDDIVQNTGGRISILYGGTINLNKGKNYSNIDKVQPDFLSGCCLYFHKDIIGRVGFFDETYESYFEDVDYSVRAKNNGVRLEVVWDWKLKHYHSMSTKTNSGKKDYLIARNAIFFAKSNFSGIKKYIFIVSSIIVGFFWVVPRPKNLPYFFRGVINGIK